MHKSQECPCVEMGGASQALIHGWKKNGKWTRVTPQSCVKGGVYEAKIEILYAAGKFSSFFTLKILYTDALAPL